MNCFTILLHIFNIVFIILGTALVGIGIWTAVAKIYVSFVIGDTLFSAASYLIIASGIIIMLVCIVGIIGVCKEKRKWLIVYLVLLIICFVVLVASAVVAIVFKGEVENLMVNNMRTSLINGYDLDREITSAWDQLQKELRCCAVSETLLSQTPLYDFPYIDNTVPLNMEERERQDSWPIYKRTEFYRKQESIGANDRKYVPPSCCVYDSTLRDYRDLKHCQNFPNGPPNNYAIALKNEHLYYSGCYEKGKQFVMEQSDIIVAVGFVFAFLMIAGMVLTFLILRSTVDDDHDEVKHRRQPRNIGRE